MTRLCLKDAIFKLCETFSLLFPVCRRFKSVYAFIQVFSLNLIAFYASLHDNVAVLFNISFFFIFVFMCELLATLNYSCHM